MYDMFCIHIFIDTYVYAFFMFFMIYVNGFAYLIILISIIPPTTSMWATIRRIV